MYLDIEAKVRGRTMLSVKLCRDDVDPVMSSGPSEDYKKFAKLYKISAGILLEDLPDSQLCKLIYRYCTFKLADKSRSRSEPDSSMLRTIPLAKNTKQHTISISTRKVEKLCLIV